MRPFLLLGAVLVGAWIAPPALAACVAPPGTQAVKSTADAAVTVEEQIFDPSIDEKGRIWRGCATAVGTQVELESGYSEFNSWKTIADRFALAGPFVAYRVATGDRRSEQQWLTLVDLRSGTRWSTRHVASNDDDIGYVAHAVNAAGDLAFVRSTYRGPGTSRWRLYLRHAGRVRLLHESRTVISGLRISASEVRWRERGRPHTRPVRA